MNKTNHVNMVQNTRDEKSSPIHGGSKLTSLLTRISVFPLYIHAKSVIDEEAFEPPAPDYAHLPARQFQPRTRTGAPSTAPNRKKLTIKESELAPMKVQIDKANAARAFKDRFSSGHTANVLRIDEGGVARRQKKSASEEDMEDEIDDIDSFLAELDVNASNGVEQSSTEKAVSTTGKRDTRAELDSFVDTLI
jgi:hypothetical protein